VVEEFTGPDAQCLSYAEDQRQLRNVVAAFHEPDLKRRHARFFC